MVEHPSPCVFSKEQHGKQHWPESIKHSMVLGGKQTLFKYLSNSQVAAAETSAELVPCKPQ